MAGIWIIAEQADGRISPVSYELLTRGRALADKRGCELAAIVIGGRLVEQDLAELIRRGADVVQTIESPALAQFDLQPYAACLIDAITAQQPEIVIAAATTTGRTLMPYVAARCEAGLTADCTELDIEPQTHLLLQTRPAIGGNVLATIKTPRHRPQMATVRPHSMPQAPSVAGRSGTILRTDAVAKNLATRVRRLGFTPHPDKHNLADAEAIVAVGRGIKKAENLPMIYRLAELLDAAVGATRDVVDRGWLSYPHQIGLSGKTVTPRLYVAIGASGSVQHLAGMQTSETIIAINSDAEAPIFRVANFGIVGDLFDVVPALIARLEKVPSGKNP